MKEPRSLTRISLKARALACALIFLASFVISGAYGLDTSTFRALGAKIASPPSINARSAILIDAATGTVLFEKNADLALPPASLTKLVTLHVVMNEIAAGRLSLDQMIDILPQDTALPYGSSLMYLQPGMKVSLRDIMLGAAVVSGNDAAYTLARVVAGSNEKFAEMMNQAVRQLGFERLTFVEPSGLSEKNLVTAREFALFCKDYIELHPQALKDLHSVKSIRFPRPEHATANYHPDGVIIQYNRNPLIFSYEGADGLKTGYIIEVGYNMAATAARNGSRYIAVLLGGSSTPYANGVTNRTRDSKALLDWAFGNFSTARPGYIMPKSIRVWFGKNTRVQPEPDGEAAVTVASSLADRVSAKIETLKSVKAPVHKGDKLGSIVYSVDGKTVGSVDLVSQQEIPKGGFFRMLFDSVARFFAYIFGRA